MKKDRMKRQCMSKRREAFDKSKSSGCVLLYHPEHNVAYFVGDKQKTERFKSSLWGSKSISRSEFCTLVLSPGVTATSFDEGMKLQDRLNESLEGVDNALSLDAKIDAMKEDGIIGYTPASGKKEKPTPGPPLN